MLSRASRSRLGVTGAPFTRRPTANAWTDSSWTTMTFRPRCVPLSGPDGAARAPVIGDRLGSEPRPDRSRRRRTKVASVEELVADHVRAVAATSARVTPRRRGPVSGRWSSGTAGTAKRSTPASASAFAYRAATDGSVARPRASAATDGERGDVRPQERVTRTEERADGAADAAPPALRT